MSRLVLQTVQWSELQDIEDVDPISDRDLDVLAEIKSVLQRHGYMERFGVCLLHKHFELTEDEVAVEYTDHDERISTVRVEKRQLVDKSKSIETVWRFSSTSDGQVVTVCKQQCIYASGHKPYHVKVGQ